VGSTNTQSDPAKISLALRLDVAADLFRLLKAPAGGAMSMVMDVQGNGAIASMTGASLTQGGAWTNASSREYKDNIRELSAIDALETVRNLTPVSFTYKADNGEHHVGFIAEDVPDLVATKDRKGLSAMDIVAVLTKTVQVQQKTIEEQQKHMEQLNEKLAALELAMGRIDNNSMVNITAGQ